MVLGRKARRVVRRAGRHDRVGADDDRGGDQHRAEGLDVAADAEAVFSAIHARPSSTVAMPIGTLMKQIQCQLSSWVIATIIT
jgi:hypothetical protein